MRRDGREVYWLTTEQLERARADWPPSLLKPTWAYRTADWSSVWYRFDEPEERK